jgi:hypothetical protein
MALVESAAAALAVAAILVWFGSCLVGSFHPDDLGRPYWPQIGGPRTDTSGVMAFAVLVCALAVSETLRVSRRRRLRPESSPRAPLSPAAAATTGVAAAVSVASIGLVLYLSVNAVTHPATLDIQATHFATWPTEGTLRVLALAFAALATGCLRFATILRPGSWIGS